MPVIINGTTGISGVDGTAATPAIQGSDTNTGVFFPAADTIAFTEGGVEVLRINSSSQVQFQAGTSSLPSITASGDLNAGIFFPAADTIGFATSGAEEFRIGPAGQFGIAGANYGTSGQVLTSGGSGASPSWATATSMVLLGTLTTTSGASQSLTGLTLTSYKQITLVFVGVSHSDAGSQSYLVGTSTADDVAVSTTFGNTATANGFVFIALSSGTFSSALSNASNAATVLTGTTPLRTSSTSISVAPLAGSFDAGSILVYGVS
jgi:hypothetical protein